MTQARLRTKHEPDNEGCHRGEDDHRHEVGRHLVCEPLDSRLAALCLSDHLDDLGEQGFRAHPLCLHHERPGSTDGATGELCAGTLLGRDRFACDHGVIHRALAADDDAVHWYAITRLHPQSVPDPNLLQRNLFLGCVRTSRETNGGLGRKPQEAAQCQTGLAPGA